MIRCRFHFVFLTTGQALVARQGSIETSNGPVSIDLTSLGPFSIASRNGGILGVFNVSSSLTLKTRNDKIKAVVALNPDKDGSGTLDIATEHRCLSSTPSSFYLITKRLTSRTNSLINLDVALNPFQKSATGGSFAITSTSSHSPTRLRVREAPVDARLRVNVSTTSAPAELLLPSTFEGAFDVAAAHFWPTVFASEHVRDPSGEGRKRIVVVEKEGSHASGSVGWSEEGRERGHVELRTTHSPALLKL